MSRTYAKFGDWGALGFKKAKPYKPDEKKREAQRTKFARCRACGGQMTYLAGTNTLICNNEVEKKRIKRNEDGSVVEYTVTEVCGAINMVDEQYRSYLNYLFN